MNWRAVGRLWLLLALVVAMNVTLSALDAATGRPVGGIFTIARVVVVTIAIALREES